MRFTVKKSCAACRFALFYFLLVGCASSPLQNSAPSAAVAPSAGKEDTSLKDPPATKLELAGDYDIFNRLDIKTQRYGLVKEGHYYWGTIRVGIDRRVSFYVDEKFQKDYVYQIPIAKVLEKNAEKVLKKNGEENRVKVFLAFGTLPLNGNLSRIYFYTPKESGYLFSGSLCRNSLCKDSSRKESGSTSSGMTSLLPEYYTKHFVNVCFVKR